MGRRPPAPFVVGAPRSGTTLLRLMLDAHPDLAIPPETNFIPRVTAEAEVAGQSPDGFFTTITSLEHWGDWQLDPAAFRARLAAIDPFDVGDALRAFYQIYAERFGKPRWGDKTPDFVREMRKIQAVLPEARFVHIIRDGRDVALSNLALWFGPNRIDHAAFWWYSLMTEARVQVEHLDYYLEVRYEDLVRCPEPVLRQVCDFIELPWDAAMLQYHERAEARLAEENRPETRKTDGLVVSGAERLKIHELTKRPPQAERIGRWRQEMSAEDVELFEAIGGESLREFGYEVVTADALDAVP